ncbi:MAG: hypothetical protein H8D63_02040 [Parcubacteria group bacterium]|nr:hypothetical protein [Parcubacteria group bacterium]
MKKIEPFLILGPIQIAPVIPQVYARMGHLSEDVKTVLECIAGHSELNGSLVDVCFIHKQELFKMYNVEYMSMNDMCMYVINEGGRLCPYQLWPQFAKAYTDIPIGMPEFVSLITNTLNVRVPEKLMAYTEHDLAWRRCSCGEIEPFLTRAGLTYDALAYVRVRKESTSALKLPRFQAG